MRENFPWCKITNAYSRPVLLYILGLAGAKL